MNTPQKVGSWAAAVTASVLAIASIVGPGRNAITSLIAQEAEIAAEKAVEQKMAPTTYELRSIKDLLRDQAVLAEYRLCLDTRLQLPEGVARIARCDREIEYRRLVYRFTDCTVEKELNEEDPALCPVPIEPPELP